MVIKKIDELCAVLLSNGLLQVSNLTYWVLTYFRNGRSQVLNLNELSADLLLNGRLQID
jgi:hypothetical protein